MPPEPEHEGNAPEETPVRWDEQGRRWVWSRLVGESLRGERYGALKAGCGCLVLVLLLAAVTVAIYRVTTGQ